MKDQYENENEIKIISGTIEELDVKNLITKDIKMYPIFIFKLILLLVLGNLITLGIISFFKWLI